MERMNQNLKLIHQYEWDANLKLARICRICIIFLFLMMLLNILGVFVIDNVLYPVVSFCIMIMMLPTLFYNVMKTNSLFVRYVVLVMLVIMSGILYAFLSYHVIIMLIFPVVISCLYCDKRNVIFTYALGIPVMVISHIIAYNLKIVPDEPLVTMKGVIIYGVLPRILEYSALSIACISTTKKIQDLINALVKKNEELLSEQEGVIISLSQMIESQSRETGSHVKRVSEYTKIICRHLGYDDETVWQVGVAAMMHDAGKILIPHEILEKPGKLTDEEYAIVKKHTIYGKRLLENSSGELMQLSAKIAYEHHERYDGNGYEGIRGEDISMFSRCVSVADVFDALVSWRPYKKAWKPEEARREIVAQSGRQFDPQVVKVFDDNFSEFLEVFERYPDSLEAVDTEAIYKG